MLTLDGSIGEGGGQILRTALALSVLTRTPFQITHIRAGRHKPGLLRQHLTGVHAAQAISGASVTGDALGSTAIAFIPQDTIPGEYAFAVGSAGSANLVLQTILPPLMLANAPSRIQIDGGTHNDASPPYHFLEAVFAPLLARMGPRLGLSLNRWGFAPAGGGRLTAEISPVAKLSALLLLERGDIEEWEITAAISAIPESVGHREVAEICKRLHRPLGDARVFSVPDPVGPGNVVWVKAIAEHVTALFTSFGKQGLPAEEVAKRLCKEVEHWKNSGTPVDEHLADQLLIPLALGGGAFRTTEPSEHTRTNAQIIQKFLGTSFRIEPEGDAWWIGV